MKRTPLKRTTRLRRLSPMKRKRARRAATTDYDYMAAVRELPCVCKESTRGFLSQFVCLGRIEANHAGAKPGMSLKAADDTTIPMCTRHHGMWTDHNGIFRCWTKAARREWADRQIIHTRAAIAEMRRAA